MSEIYRIYKVREIRIKNNTIQYMWNIFIIDIVDMWNSIVDIADILIEHSRWSWVQKIWFGLGWVKSGSLSGFPSGSGNLTNRLGVTMAQRCIHNTMFWSFLPPTRWNWILKIFNPGLASEGRSAWFDIFLDRKIMGSLRKLKCPVSKIFWIFSCPQTAQ